MEYVLIEAIGYCGTALTIASYSMRTIIPLRVVGILSSLLFLVYGAVKGSWPVIITDAILLPLNIIRLMQILRAIKRIDEIAETGELSTKWLRPFGRQQKYAAGAVVFNAGDSADYLLLIASGKFELREAGIVLGQAQVVGELGFLSPGNRRTMTLVCIEDGEVSRVTYDHVKQLYYSDPKFAFYFLRLVSDRLFQNLDRAERAKVAA